jgi:hypothetical protein
MLGGAIETSRLLARTSATPRSRPGRSTGHPRRELGEVLATIAREAGSLGGGDSAIVLLNGDSEPRVGGSHGEGALEVVGVPGGLKSGPLLPLLLATTPATVAVLTSAGPARAFVVPLRAGDEALGALVGKAAMAELKTRAWHLRPAEAVALAGAPPDAAVPRASSTWSPPRPRSPRPL